MERNVIVAIALSLAVLFLYPYLLKQIYPEPIEQQAVVEQAAPAAIDSAETLAATAATGDVVAPRPAAPPAPARPAGTITTVDTPLYTAELTNVGGAIKSWKLKNYRLTMEKDSPAIDFIDTPAGETTNRTEFTRDGATEVVIFEPVKRSISIEGDEKATVVFTGKTKDGLTVVKKYTFTAWNYTTQTELFVKNAGDAPYEGQAATVLAANFIEEVNKARMTYHKGPIIQTSEDLIRQKADDVRQSGTGVARWLGLEDKYFLNVLIPTADTPISWLTEIPNETSSRATARVDMSLAPGAAGEYGYLTFLGPKDYNLLTAHDVGLGEAIEFGWFSFMAKPMLAMLNLFQRYVVNYGIAIIILTVIIKVIFYPLTKHSLSSMKEMQKVQPQLKAVKEKYKDDKDRQNKELMALYKKYKINPLSGCLPMVLQIPVFIALYEVLYVAIELRHAPMFLWITDLSAKDPYYITPLLMGGSMFLQQKMTPTSIDPAQAKIMMLMPVIFTFMFLNFPSGLVLYWLVNNVLSVAQQYLINRSPSPVRA